MIDKSDLTVVRSVLSFQRVRSVRRSKFEIPPVFFLRGWWSLPPTKMHERNKTCTSNCGFQTQQLPYRAICDPAEAMRWSDRSLINCIAGGWLLTEQRFGRFIYYVSYRIIMLRWGEGNCVGAVADGKKGIRFLVRLLFDRVYRKFWCVVSNVFRISNCNVLRVNQEYGFFRSRI